MKKRTWKTYAFWILLSEAAGGLSGWLARDGMRIYKAEVLKPPLSPPDAVFPVVWTVLFALMGAGAARVDTAPPSPARRRGLRLFLIQLGFNFCWSIVFFNLQCFGLALIWLAVMWILILWMTWNYWQADRPAAWMQVPYLLWAAFAGYLNLGVWLLNRR